jgi:hypothetical protein
MSKHRQPAYEPERWNSDPAIRNSHNCYTYFLNKIDPALAERCRRSHCGYKNGLKPQPGHHSRKHRPIEDGSLYTCQRMVQRTLDDNPAIRSSTRNGPCPRDHYKGALTVDPGSTYHFYRQDANGYWSHKDGSNPATDLDASSNPITDPEAANRDYGYRESSQKEINYEDFCGYFCIPNDPDQKFMDRLGDDWKDFVRET